jgi:hypothetical protein
MLKTRKLIMAIALSGVLGSNVVADETVSSQAIYDSKTKTLSLEGILVPFIDEFTGKETDNKGIFDAQLQEKTKLVFELIPWSITNKNMFNGDNTSGYILYDHKTRSVNIPCFEVVTTAIFGDAIEGETIYYKDVNMKQRHLAYPIFHVEDMTETNNCENSVIPEPEEPEEPPKKPTLTTTPTTTIDDTVEVEVNGEDGTTVFVNGVDSGKTIDSTGKVKITLDTSGDDGDKNFSITLKDDKGNESEALAFSIKKIPSSNHVMSFDGADDYIVTNSSVIAENSKPYTVSVTVIPGELDYGYIISNGGQTNGATGMFITQGVYQNGDNAHFQFGVSNESQSFHFIGGNVEVGVETTLTIVYNGNTMSIYQDSKLIGIDNTPAAGRNLSMLNITLGGASNIPNAYEYKGEIDDVQIYNQALSADDVVSIQNGNTLDNSNLTLYYDFEGDNPLEDKSGNNNNAIAYGNATVIEQTR